MYHTKYFSKTYPSEVHKAYAEWLEEEGKGIEIISVVSLGRDNLLVTYKINWLHTKLLSDIPPPPPSTLRPRE